MTTAQKIIKYLALAFAACIIVSIVSGILVGIEAFSEVLGLQDSKDENRIELNENIELSEIATNINEAEMDSLKIELAYANLRIENGEEFRIESNSNKISCVQKGSKVIVKERNNNWISKNKASELIIYIPEDKLFEEIDFEAGAGKIDIESLTAKEVSFEVGAGKTVIEQLNVSKEARIDGGVGNVSILSGVINNLDLDMGVGKFEMTAKLTGKSDIDSGIGEMNIELEDGIENYTIKASKGIGPITISNKEVSDDTEYGNGQNYIKIDGGVGSIKIK